MKSAFINLCNTSMPASKINAVKNLNLPIMNGTNLIDVELVNLIQSYHLTGEQSREIAKNLLEALTKAYTYLQEQELIDHGTYTQCNKIYVYMNGPSDAFLCAFFRLIGNHRYYEVEHLCFVSFTPDNEMFEI
jgi:hypothetical protein